MRACRDNLPDTGLGSDGSAWYGPEGGGPIAPSNEFRFGFLGEGTAKDCPNGGRAARKKDLLVGDKTGEGEGGDGWLSFFLKNLPNIFFGPLVDVELLSVRVIVDAGGEAGPTPSDESERAGVCTPSGPPGRGAACKMMWSWCSSKLVRLLGGGSREVDAAV